MTLRIFIMAMLGSTITTFVAYFNAMVLVVGRELGVRLANFMNIDPYIQLSVAGAGIAYDVMLILFISVLLIELALSDKVIKALDKIDTFLWKLLKY